MSSITDQIIAGRRTALRPVWHGEFSERIDDMRYDAAMKEDGIEDILKFGIAFSGKKVRVRAK